MHRVAILAVDGVINLDLALPGQVFGTAHALEKPAGALFGVSLYDIRLCGQGPGLAVNGVGGVELYRLTAPYGLADVLDADTVMVPGATLSRSVAVEVLDVLRAAHRRGARIASICSGAFMLAEAGLLDGRRATTHWTCAESMARTYPEVQVDPNVLFVDEGDVLTSAGAAAGLDLCLHMVRNDFGAAVAAEVARHVVVPPQRDGGQAQYIVHPEPDGNHTLEPTLRWMRERVGESLTLTEIARHASVSARTLNRRFQEQTGTTPLRWLLRQRVRRAQELLETTDLSIEEISRRCGFGSSVALRQQFAKQVRVSPLAYRRAFQQHATVLG